MGKFRITSGNITDDTILKGHDSIVNPTNPRMVCGAGVSGSIFKKAGVNLLEEYTSKTYNITYENSNNLMKVGEVRITPGFNLNMDIIFVQGGVYWGSNSPIEELINTYHNLLKEIKNKGYKNILCPSLGTGSYGYSHKQVGNIVKNILEEFTKENDINIDLVIYDKEDIKYYK